MKIKDRNIADLKPAEYNPRRLTDKQYKDLRRSMDEMGDLGAAVVNTYPGREDVIIAGHQRIRIAKDMGRKTFPCLEVSFDPAKEKKANLRLNKTGGEWDFDALANEFEIEELMEEGFSEKELRIGVESAAEKSEREAEEVDIKPFKQTHVLLSFPPEKLLDIQDHLDAIREVDGVEVETGSN
jgi:ParB-like chromosome segregation protein Spo0J